MRSIRTPLTMLAIVVAIFVFAVLIALSPRVKPAAPAQSSPIAAINVSHCNGAMVLFVLLDPNHLIRFDVKETTVFIRENGQAREEHGPQTPFKKALQLAESAAITTNVVAPCEDNTV